MASQLGLRRLEAADEDSHGVSYSAGLVAAVKDLISLRSGGGGLYARRAEIALQVRLTVQPHFW